MKSPSRLRAVMLDWAGTTVDHGSIAPIVALQELFTRHGIELSAPDARRAMGLLKKDHIRTILELTVIREQWRATVGRDPGDEEVELLFEEFRPLQKAVLLRHSQPIDGVARITTSWKARGLRIGSTTGYTREMLDPVAAHAAENGYWPDTSVCPDEAGAGRPAPWMLARNAQLLDVYPPSACVKIGDTVSDIEEGKNAGMWTIGITRTGNLIGLNAAAWSELPAVEKESRLRSAGEILMAAGADFIAEDLPACDEILTRIEQRIS
ncbi:MAG TPA: phosphonoacetaldehyde hydrolase [Terracidiphilus sp.]|nr:phosphonoacetaldehyde hydrolase [Terracidiphilus sp.]